MSSCAACKIRPTSLGMTKELSSADLVSVAGGRVVDGEVSGVGPSDPTEPESRVGEPLFTDPVVVLLQATTSSAMPLVITALTAICSVVADIEPILPSRSQARSMVKDGAEPPQPADFLATGVMDTEDVE